MLVVVAATIFAPVSRSFTGTFTDEPWNTWPFEGDRIVTEPVLDGRGPGAVGGEVGAALPEPEQAAPSNATAATATISTLRRGDRGRGTDGAPFMIGCLVRS